MFFSLARWDAKPIDGTTREISGVEVSFKKLPLIDRYDLGNELSELLRGKDFDFSLFNDPATLPFFERLVDMSDAPESLFDSDLTAQIPVAVTALEINLDGFFDSERMALGSSKHRAVRKAFSDEKDFSDGDMIGPHATKYWFLYRPVIAELCSYDAMFIEEKYSFFHIHRMHELLDVKQFNEIVANEITQT